MEEFNCTKMEEKMPKPELNKQVLSMIDEELSQMSEIEKHCFDAKRRYYEVLSQLEQEQIDDLCDELAVQKYPRECLDPEFQEPYDKQIEDELDSIYCNLSDSLNIEDPNKW